MKILIIAYYFYPELTPRAFRAFELSKQLAKEGHIVKVLLPKSDYDYTKISKKHNFSVDFVDFHKKTIRVNPDTVNTSHFWFKKLIRKLFKKTMYCIFPSGRDKKFYFYNLYKQLIKHREYQDMIISIATPFDTHIGAAMAFKKNKILNNTSVKIADYGDPLYKNSAFPNCPLYYWIDKFIASQFDYITIPTEKALSIHANFKKRENIKIIPQGFDFSETRIANYQVNDIPTFAYAGLFYGAIRNPKPLLDFLVKLHEDAINYVFIIYTQIDNFNNMKLLNKYKNILNGKLIINQVIPREDVIYELSKMDFLINIENLSSSQIPSKLIDYALAGRPIYSFNQINFSEDTFMHFFRRDYSEKKKINLDDFNIKYISKQFTELMPQGNTE